MKVQDIMSTAAVTVPEGATLDSVNVKQDSAAEPAGAATESIRT